MSASESNLTLEHAFYVNNAVASVLLGVDFYLCLHSISYLRVRKGSESCISRPKMTYIGVSISLLLCLAIATGVNLLYGQHMWIDDRGVSGGPTGFYAGDYAVWFNTWGSAMSVAQDCLANGVLLYRCYIFWESRLIVIIFPLIVYLASIVMAILSVIASAIPGSTFFEGTAVSFGVPWIAISAGFNLMMTSLICYRIIRMRFQLRMFMEPEVKQMYTGVVAILVESALPLSIVGIIFAVLLGINQPYAVMVSGIWVISPQLIILRVAMGRGWSSSTADQITSLAFAARETTSNSVGFTEDTRDVTMMGEVSIGKAAKLAKRSEYSLSTV